MPGYETVVRWPLDRYGFKTWTDFFSPRQLLGHCTSVEVFQELVDEIRERNKGEVPGLDGAALVYLTIAIDKSIDYNSVGLSWHPTREVLEHTFRMHSFSFKWSYAEMAPTFTGLGYDWVLQQTGKSLKELIALAGSDHCGESLFKSKPSKGSINVTLGPADFLAQADSSVDCVVIDPPYGKNVMYAELSDYFYVWLKRTAGLLFPDQFASVPDRQGPRGSCQPVSIPGPEARHQARRP